MQRPLNWWISIFLVLAALRGLILGVSGLVIPAMMPVPFELTPLNARFVAALYFAGSIGLLLTLFARKCSDARPFLFGVGTVTGSLLAITLLRWSELEIGPTGAFIGWIGSYILDPIIVAVLLTANKLWLAPGQRHPLATLFYVEAAVMGMLGLALLLAPDAMAAQWPWPIAPFLAQLYSCFFIAFAAIALLVAQQGEPTPIRNFATTSLTLLLLVLLSSLLHVGRFTPGLASMLWFGVLVLGTAAFGYALLHSMRTSHEYSTSSNIDWSVDSGAPSWW